MLGTVAVGFIVPWAAAALGIPLAVALVVPAVIVGHGGAEDDLAALNGEVSAGVVDALHGAAELLAFGADRAALDALDALGRRADALERRQARLLAGAGVVMQVCVAAAVAGITAVGVIAVHDHRVDRSWWRCSRWPRWGRSRPSWWLRSPWPCRGRAPRPSGSSTSTRCRSRSPIRRRPRARPVECPRWSSIEPHCGTRRDCPGPSTASRSSLPPGGRLAVTGSSGAGKSSLVNALLRYWPLEEGSLLLGGTDVTHLAQADVRGACALADQRAQLFAGTLKSNLVLGRPEAGDDDIAAALAVACLAEWVATLPLGLDTPVGEDGVELSGGERRRLAVARAVLAPGPVLVLDEPTSGLDPKLADTLLDGVLGAAAASGRSVLLVTHRQAEAARCEAVLTLESGHVVPVQTERGV